METIPAAVEPHERYPRWNDHGDFRCVVTDQLHRPLISYVKDVTTCFAVVKPPILQTIAIGILRPGGIELDLLPKFYVPDKDVFRCVTIHHHYWVVICLLDPLDTPIHPCGKVMLVVFSPSPDRCGVAHVNSPVDYRLSLLEKKNGSAGQDRAAELLPGPAGKGPGPG